MCELEFTMHEFDLVVAYLIGHNLIVNVINEWQLNIVNYKFFNE